MAVGIVLLATAGFTLLSNATAASMPSSSSRSRQGSSAPPRSSSYTATGVQTDADTSHAIDANLHPAVLRMQRLHPQGDLGVSYIGDPPDTGEAISRAELFAMMLRKEVNPATRHATPRQKKERRIAPSVKETSQRRAIRGPAPSARSRLSYVKTVSYVPFPFYGFGYGLHHYSPWTYYSPLGR